MLFLIFLGSTLFCLYVWYFLTRRRISKMTACIPTLPGELPLVGHIFNLLGDESKLHDMISSMSLLANDLGGITKVWAGPVLLLVITDPDVAKEIVNVNMQKPFVYKMASAWLGEGLLIADATIWKVHRKLLNPVFNQQVLNSFMESFNYTSERFVDNLKKYVDKGEFDPTDVVSQASVESYLKTITGLSVEELLAISMKFMKAAEDIGHLYTNKFLSVINPNNFLKWREYNKQEAKLTTFFHEFTEHVLQQKKAAMLQAENNDNAKSLIDVLLRLHEKDAISYQEILDELNTMAVAGTETVALTSMYILIALGSYPDIQQKVFNEVQEVFPDSNTEVTKDDLPNLVYTEAFVKEVLRMYTLVPIIGRYLDTEIKFDKYTIPAGTQALISLWGMSRQNSLGDPNIFRPERWLEPDSAPKLYAFSIGSRNCIGKKYALMLLKTFVAHTIRKYSFSADCSKLKLQLAVNAKPVSGHHISLTERRKQ